MQVAMKHRIHRTLNFKLLTLNFELVAVRQQFCRIIADSRFTIYNLRKDYGNQNGRFEICETDRIKNRKSIEH